MYESFCEYVLYLGTVATNVLTETRAKLQNSDPDSKLQQSSAVFRFRGLLQTQWKKAW